MSATEQIKLLHDLQQVDQQISEIEHFRDTTPERLKLLEGEVEQFRTALKEKEAEMKAIHDARRTKERDLEQHEAQINKNKERMMAVKTNEEYHAVQRENEKQKEMIEELEDQILRLMDDFDTAELALKKAKTRFAELDKQKREQIAEINGRLAIINDQLTVKEAERQKILPLVDPSFLLRYQRLRDITGGVAVVRVVKRTCQGCQVNVPPQIYNLVIRNEEIITCPSCRRILYFEPDYQGGGAVA